MLLTVLVQNIMINNYSVQIQQQNLYSIDSSMVTIYILLERLSQLIHQWSQQTISKASFNYFSVCSKAADLSYEHVHGHDYSSTQLHYAYAHQYCKTSNKQYAQHCYGGQLASMPRGLNDSASFHQHAITHNELVKVFTLTTEQTLKEQRDIVRE